MADRMGEVTFRPVTLDDDAFVARLEGAIDPSHPLTAAEVRQRWVNTAKTASVRRFIVQVDGDDRGFFSLVNSNADSADALNLVWRVPETEAEAHQPALRLALEQAREMGVARVQAEVTENLAGAREALAAEGFVEERRQRFWRLELAPHARRLLRDWEEARTRMAAAGIAIRSAAELGGEAVYPRIHQLDDSAARDVPSSVAYTGASYEDWLTWMRPPAVLPERVWLAQAGEELVGLSYLRYEASLVSTGFTGVLSEFRGRGIARALKLETLAQAIELGVEAVETDNDFENAPILHLNADLGYTEIPGKVVLLKQLPPAR